MTVLGSRATTAAFLKVAGLRLEAAADRLLSGDDAAAARLLQQAQDAWRQAAEAGRETLGVGRA